MSRFLGKISKPELNIFTKISGFISIEIAPPDCSWPIAALYVCVCVCVCEREREREREVGGKGEREE